MAIQSRPPESAPPDAVPVLLIRPAEQSRRFADQMAARFGDRVAAMIAPLIAPRFLTVAPPPAEALILTSETGVEAARRIVAQGPGLPRQVWCVGDRTAEAARDAGFAATSAGGDAEALIRLILAARPAGPMLHLRGAEARGDIAARLTQAGIPTRDSIAYVQEPQTLGDPAKTLLQGDRPLILPLFSPRSALLFHAAARPRAPVFIAALSPAVAAAAQHRPAPAGLRTAAQPDAKAMRDTLADLLRDIGAT